MSKSKTKIATTIEQFIVEVNNSIGGRYENNGEANENKSALRIEINTGVLQFAILKVLSCCVRENMAEHITSMQTITKQRHIHST